MKPIFILFFGLSCLVTTAASAETKLNFSRDIKPILSNRCFTCHGPDKEQRKAELRLDLREAAVQEVIKPGKSAESELVARITNADPEQVMPPPSSKKPALTPAEIDLLKRWIDEGAVYDAHWAYQPVAKAATGLPTESFTSDNPIDPFISASLAKQNLALTPPADRRTVLRRLSFDLLGLPPTPQQLAEFEADQSPQAYEKVVDRLLASPHYGERMAQYWLDVVRYADTGGYHSDNHRDVAPYRDYVIGAFNNNKPFDQFTIEQLAGDLLPNATTEQRIASGYNRLLQTTEEGGAQPKEYTAKYAADRVRNTATIWLASTMGCCECHDHKFDPFSTKDFYSFAAFFADVSEAAVGRQGQTKVPTAEQEQGVRSLEEQIVAVKKTLETTTPELNAAQLGWEQVTLADLAKKPSNWTLVKPEKAESSGGTTLAPQEDLSLLATGKNPAQDIYTITLPPSAEPITALRIETLLHPSLTNKSLSRANGNFVLTGVEVLLTVEGAEAKKLKIASAEADFSQPSHDIALAIDDKAETGWAVAGHQTPANHQALFVFAEPVTVPPSGKLVLKLLHQSPYAQHNIGCVRVSTTAFAKPTLGQNGVPQPIAEALKLPAEQRSEAQTEALAKYYRGLAQLLDPARKQLADLEKSRADLQNAFPTTLVSMAGAPRVVRILPRGNWLDDSGPEVQPAIPGFLVSLPSGAVTPPGAEVPAPVAPARQSRLDLARWMVSPENPLVARVFVNRLWKLALGRGIVRTTEDFGSQGELPTHPELLDWLARDFVEHRWDIKRTYKLILMSQTYRQGSLVSLQAKEKDPLNQWFSRQNRFRLEAEEVRDNALAVSGLLSPKIGGPSVKPYQPAGYWQFLNFPTREWANDHGDDLYRRGVYTYWQRTFLHPSLAAFDAPSREECTVERARSNTPQQALVLLNDPTYVEAARALATKTLKEGGGDFASRLEFAFRRVLTRSPREAEGKLLADLYQQHLAQYVAEKPAAEKLLSVGEVKAPAETDAAELAAWTSLSRVLLNLHETITRN